MSPATDFRLNHRWDDLTDRQRYRAISKLIHRLEWEALDDPKLKQYLEEALSQVEQK